MGFWELLGLVIFSAALGWLIHDLWREHQEKIRLRAIAQKEDWVEWVRSMGIEVADWQVALVNREIEGEYARRLQFFDGANHGYPWD